MRSVPPALAAAFEGKLTITVSELCQLLPLDPETLRLHIRQGHISYVQMGFGEKAPRRAFTLENVAAFLAGQSRTERMAEANPGRRAAYSGNAGGFLARLAADAAAETSSEASAFLARRAQRLAQERAAGNAEPGARKRAPRP